MIGTAWHRTAWHAVGSITEKRTLARKSYCLRNTRGQGCLTSEEKRSLSSPPELHWHVVPFVGVATSDIEAHPDRAHYVSSCSS